MSLQQQPQNNPMLHDGPDRQRRFLHLRGIDVDFTRPRPDSKLEIKFKDESGIKYKSTVFKKTEPMHWECDIFVKFLSAAVIEVQKPHSNLQGNRLVAAFRLELNAVELVDDKIVEQKDQDSGINIKFLFGKLKPNLEVTRLLADKAVSALATKVSMLDKLDQVFKFLDLVAKFGHDAAQLNPAAQAAVSSVTRAFKKFQEIPRCHQELVFIMDDMTSMLPVMKLALERVTDVEAQGLLQKFVDLVKRLSLELIEYSSQSPLEFIFRNWYKSKKDETDKLKYQLLQVKLNLGLSMDVDLKGTASEIRLHQLLEADEKALERLRPPGSSSYDPSHTCLPGTRALPLQRIQQWALLREYSSRLYWMYGVAGCGKSSIAASTASTLDSQNILCGSFFCKRDIPERRDPIRLVHSMAYFLARACTPFRKVLLTALKKDPTIPDKPLSTLFKALLADRLSEISQSVVTDPIVIVLDALDECDENKTVSSFLMRMVTLAPWLRFIVTSRPLPDIREELQSSGDLTISRDLFSMSAYDDILSFIRNEFGPKGRLAALCASVSDVQLEALAEMASGLFIWIATVLSYISLRKMGKLVVLKQILSSTTSSETEKKLDALYLQVLNSAAASEDSRANKDAIQLIIGLVFVTSRNRPLPANALYAFIPSELGVLPCELESVLHDLGSVIVADSQTDAIRVCHPSFLDFIGSQARSGNFWMETAELDTIMARRCFEIMMAGLKFNICELESSYLPNSDVDDLGERVARCIPPELQYSCLYWMNHLSGSEVDCPSEESVSQMLRNLLCQTTSMYWLEALSLMSELKAATVILHKFPDFQKRLKTDAELHDRISDLYRFVMAFHEGMATSAPHIYISALLWAPSESIIAKSQCLKFNSQQCVLEGRNKYWPISLQTISLDSIVNCIAYSPDGRHIVSGSGGKTIRIWDAHRGVAVGEPLRGHSGWVSSVAYSPDGRHIVSGSRDKTIRIWDAHRGVAVGEPLRGHSWWVNSVTYSPDGRHIVSGSGDKTIRIWDAHRGVAVGEPLRGHSNWVNSVAYSPDGRHIVSGSRDETVRIWDAHSGVAVGETLRGHSARVNSITYSPDGRHVVSGSDDRTIRIWDTHSGVAVGEPLRGHSGWVSSVAYSPDGRHIVSGSHDETIRIWDAHRGVAVGEPLRGHSWWVNSVAYSPDGRHIVSGSRDKTIRIWDAHRGVAVGEPLRGHSNWVNSVAYSPGGRHIVSGSDDEIIRVWDAQSHTRIGELAQFQSCWHAYSPDGKCFISSSASRTSADPEAPEIQTVVYSQIPLNIPDDGWIRTLDGRLLLWVPYEYRNGMCDMSNVCIPHNAAGHCVRIDWEKLCHGRTWTTVKVDHEKE